ncbi:MAG: DUF1570 domain-containing protein [Planctomycetota bacterium]|jgi:hypothetical protein
MIVMTRTSGRGRAGGICAGAAAVLLVLGALVAAAPQDGAARRRALQPWWNRAHLGSSSFYRIRTDLPRERLEPLARHLDRMYDEFSRRLASLEPRAPDALDVLIFSRRDDYELTLRARFGIDAKGTGGMFFVSPQGSALAFWLESLPQRRIEHVMQHEGFHQFAHSRFGDDLPIWVNEGLAEFFGQSVLAGRTLVLGQATPRVVNNVRDAIEMERSIPFQRMLTMSSREWRENIKNGNARLQYDQAWSMVHFLVYGDGGRYVGAFERYLHLVNEGFPSDVAFTRAFGGNGGRDRRPDAGVVQAFEARWKKAAAAARPSAFLTALERIEFLAEGSLELKQRGELPGTLDGLRESLRAIDFAYGLDRHGLPATELKANDDALFEIPPDDLGGDAARFVVEPPDLRRATARERHLHEQDPVPASIRSVGLAPNEIAIRWIRVEAAGEFRYEIVVR